MPAPKPCSKRQLEYASKISQMTGKKLPEYMNQRTLSAYIGANQDEYFRLKDIADRQNQNILIERIKSEVDIVGYAEEIGFHTVRKGRYFSLKEHDSVMIDPERNKFWQNSVGITSGSAFGSGGSVIDFAMRFGNMTTGEAIRYFAERVGAQQQTVSYVTHQVSSPSQKPTHITLPQQANTMRNAFAYLTKSRHIHPDIVQDFVDQKMLYQDTHNNCVFVAYDRDNPTDPVFAMKRGTNTYKRFVGDVYGCNYEKGFYIDNHAPNMIVTESVIDAMSVMTILKDNGQDYKAYDYLPMAGATKFEAVEHALNQSSKEHVLLALDNDKGGLDNAQKLTDHLQPLFPDVLIENYFPQKKDWNQELTDYSKIHGWAKGLSFQKTILNNPQKEKINAMQAAMQDASQTYAKMQEREHDISQEL